VLEAAAQTVEPVQQAAKAPRDSQRLWDAVQAGEVKAVRQLIAEGVDVNTRQLDGKTPLHLAVAGGNLPLVQALLKAPEIRVNAADERGTQPLHLAVRENHPAIVDALSRHGAELEADSWFENRPLQLAVDLGHEKVARRLIQHGAEINGQSWQGYTPLYWAARRGNLGLVKTLLAHQADVAIPNRYGETPLHGAARGGNAAVVKVMLDALSHNKGAVSALPDVFDISDHEGNTPLHLAARNDHLAVLAELTARGGDMQRVSGNGETPQTILDKRRQIRAHRESGLLADA
jgi:ankyrin repeat protein